MGSGTPAKRTLTGVEPAQDRPPSVDALARSLARSTTSGGLPHAILVDIARQAIADGDPSSAAKRADAFRRTLLTPVINATGVLLHTNLGRAPLAHVQSARLQTVEFDLASGDRGVAPAGGRVSCSPACAAPSGRSSSTTTPPPCCSCSPPWPTVATWSSRGGSRSEIGGSFRVPDVMEQSGARLLDVGTTNRTRLGDYARAIVRPGTDVALVLKVHPSNYRLEGFVESTSVAELATLTVPVVVDLGSGLLDAGVPWLGRTATGVARG